MINFHQKCMNSVYYIKGKFKIILSVQWCLLIIIYMYSIADLKAVEINERSDITKLKIIINNILSIKNYYKDKENLHSDESNIIK